MRHSSMNLAFYIGASLALAPEAGAQGERASQVLRYTKPLKTVSLNLETGEIRRGPQIRNQNVTTTSDLSNFDLGGFLGVDTGGGFCQWIESAFKGSGAGGVGPVPSDLVTNFIFAYCSSALGTASSGPGGSMSWDFFQSHTTGAPHPSTSDAVASFTLTGLPANSTSGALFTAISCFFINITFGAAPLPFADGQIGYAWTFEDTDINGVLAATVPFLSCVSSCSGIGPDGMGIDGLIDRYCGADQLPGSLPTSTFSFGTSALGGYFFSIAIDIRELDVDASVTTFQGTSPGSLINPDRLGAEGAIIGQDWQATITPQVDRTGAFSAVLLVQDGGPPASSLNLDLATTLGLSGSAPLSQLLFSGMTLGTLTIPLMPGLSSSGSVPIPLNTAFVCLPWYAQGICIGDISTDGVQDLDPMFTNGAMGIVGAQ